MNDNNNPDLLHHPFSRRKLIKTGSATGCLLAATSGLVLPFRKIAAAGRCQMPNCRKTRWSGVLAP